MLKVENRERHQVLTTENADIKGLETLTRKTTVVVTGLAHFRNGKGLQELSRISKFTYLAQEYEKSRIKCLLGSSVEKDTLERLGRKLVYLRYVISSPVGRVYSHDVKTISQN